MDEEGLFRVHGSLENARILTKDMRNPIVLPRDHQLTILLLRQIKCTANEDTAVTRV